MYTKYGRCGQADKGITSETLAADDGFQQKRIFAVMIMTGEFQIKRQGRIQIGNGFDNKRNTVVTLVCQGLEFKFSHVFLRFAKAKCSKNRPRNTAGRPQTVQSDNVCQRRHNPPEISRDWE